MPIDEIQTVCFVGAGVMGAFNSLLAAAAGYEAWVYDVSEAALAKVPERQRYLAEYLRFRGLCDPGPIDEVLRRVHTTSKPEEAAAGADLLSEAVDERLALKRKVLRQFEKLCPPHTIVTTNTSSLRVSEIANRLRCRDRFAALHSHLGPLLFDIVAGPRTSPQIPQILVRYVRSLGGMPVVHEKEKGGYISNTLIGAFNRSALVQVIGGHRAIEDVDRAWMALEQAPAGPFGLMDWIGLNVVCDAAHEALRHRLRPRTSTQVMAFLRPYVDRGDLGVKTGRGFYSYPDPAYLWPEFLSDEQADRVIHEGLVRQIVFAAILLVADEYAGPEEIDRTWTALMKTGAGPFGMFQQIGPKTLLESLDAQADESGYTKKERQKIGNFLRERP